jgi:4-diphosphocytidyl-2C-methyl-D-erythritol kinase
MTTIGLFDTLTLVRRNSNRAATPHADSSWFSLSCSDPALPTDGSNLVTRAANAIADALTRFGEGSTDESLTRDRVSAHLTKRIPSGAGLGGGSSDAATTLIALGRLWKLNWPLERLSHVAEQLGSDVPFFLRVWDLGPSSVCRGRGEHVRPIEPPGMGSTMWAVLITPPYALSTPAVYRRFDEMGLGSENSTHEEPPWSSWSKGSARDLMPHLLNDLEPAAFALRPELGELRAKLEKELSQIVRMSGSGSTLFSVCDTEEDAQSQADKVRGVFGIGAMAVRIAPMRGSDAEKSI